MREAEATKEGRAAPRRVGEGLYIADSTEIECSSSDEEGDEEVECRLEPIGRAVSQSGTPVRGAHELTLAPDEVTRQACKGHSSDEVGGVGRQTMRRQTET